MSELLVWLTTQIFTPFIVIVVSYRMLGGLHGQKMVKIIMAVATGALVYFCMNYWEPISSFAGKLALKILNALSRSL